MSDDVPCLNDSENFSLFHFFTAIKSREVGHKMRWFLSINSASFNEASSYNIDRMTSPRLFNFIFKAFEAKKFNKVSLMIEKGAYFAPPQLSLYLVLDQKMKMNEWVLFINSHYESIGMFFTSTIPIVVRR